MSLFNRNYLGSVHKYSHVSILYFGEKPELWSTQKMIYKTWTFSVRVNDWAAACLSKPMMANLLCPFCQHYYSSCSLFLKKDTQTLFLFSGFVITSELLSIHRLLIHLLCFWESSYDVWSVVSKIDFDWWRRNCCHFTALTSTED